MSACQRPPKQPLELIPTGADVLAQIDVASIAARVHPDALARPLSREPLAAAVFTALAECELPPARWTRVAIGLDDDRGLALAIAGPGVGQPARWRCAAERLGTATTPGDPPHAADRVRVTVEREQYLVAEQAGGRAFGVVVGPDLVVWSDAAWVDATRALATGRTKRASPPELAKLTPRLRPHATAWALGRVPPPERTLPGAPPADGALTFVFQGKLDRGLSASLEVDFETPAQAAAAAGELRPLLGASGWLSRLGAHTDLASSGLDAVRVEAEGTKFRLDVELSDHDLAALSLPAEPAR
ncbi:MAG: hypothetical protein B7733_14335 [Myxococcales bacterium FL481]|nr:MAG: hypothetical protein B7733_14335 [Myxococcales bacterium FL481]